MEMMMPKKKTKWVETQEQNMVALMMAVGRQLTESKRLIEEDGVPYEDPRLRQIVQEIKAKNELLRKVYKKTYGRSATVAQIVDEFYPRITGDTSESESQVIWPEAINGLVDGQHRKK